MKKKINNKKIINVGEKSTKNVKIKKIIEKKFSKRKENFNTMMFEVVNVKNSNAKFFIKYHIDDTTTTSSNFTKLFFEFETFSKKESAAQTHEKEQKKEFEKEREREFREDECYDSVRKGKTIPVKS